MMLVVLAVMLVAATCQAEHECQNPKEITEDFTPVFDFGDNWSFEDCGIWTNRDADAAPWRIAVSRTNGSTCFGILLSNFDFVTSKCKEVVDDFLKAPNGVKAYSGTCYDHKANITDAPSADCTGLEVKGVVALGKDSGLHLWRLHYRLTENSNPICLFNSNPKQQGGYGVYDYQIFDRKWKGRVEASVGGAPNSSQTSKMCVKIGSGQNTEGEQEFSGDFLAKEVRGRMTLRGFFFWPVAEHKIFVYTDLAPFIKQLVANSYNMYIMPHVPPPKTKTDFSKAPTLNKNGVCGSVSVPIMRRRTRQSADVIEATDYIIHGVTAKRAASPWYATVSYRPKEDYLAFYDFCGATLISNRVVLTAAHCLYKDGNQYNASDLQIALGMHDMAELTGMEQYIRAESIEVHPNYNLNTRVYDVALLFLKEEVNVTAHVRPICLWDDDYSMDILKGTNGTVVGFGETEDEFSMRRQKSETLQEGHLSVLDHRQCYIQEKVFYRKYLHPGVTFCAIEADAAFSLNPSFGASSFAIQKDNKWYLRGVVSFGVVKYIHENGEIIATHNKDYPSLLVDLGSCMEWIVQQVAQYVPLATTNQ